MTHPDAASPPQDRLAFLEVFDRHGRALLKLFGLGPRPAPACPDRRSPLEPGPTDASHLGSPLRRHGEDRPETCAPQERRFTLALPRGAVSEALTLAARRALPMLLFVAHPGDVLIRTGRLPDPKPLHGWFNLFGDDFTLHLDEAAIAEAWAVHEPNRDGGLTSLEAFDAQGTLILRLQAERDEGQAEPRAWRALLEGISPLEPVG